MKKKKKMAACMEVRKCGRMLNKFRVLNSNLIAGLQIQPTRLVRRAAFRISPEGTYAENRYISEQGKSVSCLATGTDEDTGDFFGIESNCGIKEIKEIPVVSPVEKFNYLLQKRLTVDEEPTVEEKVLVTTFGSIRLDSDNRVKFHGQHDKAFAEKLSSLHPEKYLLGKHQRPNMPHNNSNLQSKASSDLSEQEPVELTSVSDQLESKSQECIDYFAMLEELKKENINSVKTTATFETTDISPESEIHSSQNSYIDEQKEADAKQNFNYGKDLPPHFPAESYKNHKTWSSATVNYKSSDREQLEEPNIKKTAEESNSENYDMYSNKVNDQGSSTCTHTLDDDSNYIDEQYFSRLWQQKNVNGSFNQNNGNESINFIEDKYFNKSTDNSHSDSRKDPGDFYFETTQHSGLPVSHLNSSSQITENTSMYSMRIPHFNSQEEKTPELEKKVCQTVSNTDYQDISKSTKQSIADDNVNSYTSSISKESDGMIIDEHHGFNTVQERHHHVKPNIENPKTAYDYVMKLRKEQTQNHQGNSVIDGKKLSLGNEKLDSKGFSILKTQVQDFRYVNQDDIVTTLKNSILYNEHDLVVLSKPYGLVCSGGTTKQNGIDIETCLPDLAKRLFKKSVDPKLHLVHRIDKEATGILVLARTERMANLLTDLFSRNEVKRIYWVLTRGAPDIPEGIIDIPIAEGIVGNRRRMALRPDDDAVKFLAKPSRNAERAVTHYNIISTSGSATLMEVKPETNVKHQIRVHLGFGLRCPILGDHKYSHLDKIAPQKLPDDMLRRLHVQQSKVRYIPMHLHLKTLIIPEILDGKNIFFHANLPYHFARNLKHLKFKKH